MAKSLHAKFKCLTEKSEELDVKKRTTMLTDFDHCSYIMTYCLYGFGQTKTNIIKVQGT